MSEKNQKEAIASLLEQLKTQKEDEVIGNLSFKELTYEQQRRVVSASGSMAEVIATSRNLFNEYIKQNVTFTDDPVKTDILTLDVRPFVLNVLKRISDGRHIFVDKKYYELYDVQPDDLVSKLKPEVIKKDSFELVIKVPTLKVDTIYNSLLLNALSQYRNKQSKNITDGDILSINELYSFYENMKYIDSFILDGITYDFIELPTQDKITLLNQFPKNIISLIRYYRKQVDKCVTKAFTVTNPDDGSTRDMENELALFTPDQEES